MALTLNGTTGIAGANGSASTPAVQGEDTNTGVFFPAADTVAVATGGSERFRVDSSGRLGIGTSSPGAPIQAKKATTGVETILNVTAATGAYSRGPAIDFSVDFSGEYTIGQIASQNITGGAGYGGILTFSTNGSSAGTLTERARIDSSGNLLVGTTSNGATTHRIYASASNHVLGLNSESATGEVARLYSNGTAVGTISVTASATAYNTSSDYRLKENVQPMQDALAVVAQLNPVTYTWKADGSDGQGFIAHELQAVVPDCVTGEKDAVDAEGNPQYQGVDTSFLVATLVKAVQELKAEVDSLKAQLEAN
jgi:hypothetical protein